MLKAGWGGVSMTTKQASLVSVIGTAAVLLAAPAAAQVGFIDTNGNGFLPLNGPIVLNQALPPGQNIAGIVQLAPNPLATVTQNGFYNRTAIIQVDGTNTANITQFGDFSHAFIIQVGPTNNAAIAQTGNNASAFAIQLAASPITALGTGYLQRVAANLLFAPETAAALPTMAQLSAQDFSRDLLSQLGTGRGQACIDQPPPARAPLITKAVPAAVAPPCKVALFVQGNYHHGDHADAFGSTGYSYDSGGVLAGAKFYLTPELAMGPTAGYTRTAASFKQGLGSTDLDSYHFGGFLAYDTRSWFVHAMAAYGWNGYNISRTGFAAPITPKTNGQSAVAAIKAAYLFDLGMVKVGPLGGYTYSQSHVSDYAENGDPFLTQTVGSQSLRSSVVSGGVRFEPGVAAFGPKTTGYLDVTVEKNLISTTRVVQTTFTLAPGVPVFTPVRPFDDTYVRIAGGIGYDLAANTRLTVSADGVVADRGTRSVGVNAGIRFGF